MAPFIVAGVGDTSQSDRIFGLDHLARIQQYRPCYHPLECK